MGEAKFIARIRKVGATSLGVTIKKEIIELLDLKPGMLVEITIRKLEPRKEEKPISNLPQQKSISISL